MLDKLDKRSRAVLRRIRSMADEWGVGIDHREDFDREFEAPFDMNLGLDWQRRIVYFRLRRKLNSRESLEIIAGIIHELGHIVADLRYPGDEWDFLGWEWLVAKSGGFTFSEWCRANGNYSVNQDGETISEHSTQRMRLIIIERIQKAQEVGIVDATLLPLAVR